ncbi:MAG: GntR family transcriptional regulator [Planctomycetota bacterium]
MQFQVDPHSVVPPSQQLVAAVLDAIARGELRPGDKLPAVRALAAQVLVNPNTVGKAWRELEHLRVTEGRNGQGVFVTAQGPEVARALRLAETLDQLRVALSQALRAGHDEGVLRALFDEVAAAAQGEPVTTRGTR